MNDCDPRLYVRAADHALPYRTMFEEIFRTGKYSGTYNGKTFEQLVEEAFASDLNPPPPGDACQRILHRITAVEEAYEKLAKEKQRREYTPGDESGLTKLETPLLTLLHQVPRTALCLSGGGIRSAAFSLGVLEALARYRGQQGPQPYHHPVAPSALEQFDYLSTVSGGGYIGSWLIAWTQRTYDASVKAHKKTPAIAALTPQQAFHTVAHGVAGDVPHTSGDPALRPIRHLREYTSFLAPEVGLTLDTWTLAALVLRNLLVNWLMILPVILTAVAALQTVHFGIFALAYVMCMHASVWWWIAVGVLFLVAGTTAGRRMPSCPPEDRASRSDGVLAVSLWFILPLILASIFLLEFWLNLGSGWANAREMLIERFAIASFLTFFSVPVIRLVRGKKVIKDEHEPATYLLAGFGAALATSLALAATVYAVGYAFDSAMIGPSSANALHGSLFSIKWGAYLHSIDLPTLAQRAAGLEGLLTRCSRSAHLFVVFGFPLLWLLLIAASAIFSGLLGIFEEDVDREWWARAGGLMLSVLAGWIGGLGLVVVAPELTHGLTRAISLALAALATGLTGALGGASTAGGLGAAAAKSANLSKAGTFLNKYKLLVPALCSAALLILAAFLADFEQWIATKVGGQGATSVHLYIFAAALGFSLLINWVININIFSLHGMYRMRLIRAFLGASNTQRVPNPFTGFDDRDTVYEKDIPSGPGMPLHIVNATVNLVGTSNLAWRQRKAEGFTMSPLHCGGWRLGYVKTENYGRKGGLSLGTAMAISGAAFNPNMGYHSSPLVTLLMTLFNVRLGWWLPNPRYRRLVASSPPPPSTINFLEKKAPRLALGPLLREAFGGTNDESAFIELTDGGHFENLGLYEMVMRRARWIVVIDASADPHCQLEDLGNAMRKVEIDLGVPIVFAEGLRMKAGVNKGNLYCAVATIHYHVVDQVADALHSAPVGHLLYVKAGLNGNEPPDVTQYARTHPAFPHESTANQFFNEAQFESYRHLGHHEVQTVLKKGHAEEGLPTAFCGASPLVQALFAAANSYTGKPARPVKPAAAVPGPASEMKSKS